MDKGTALSIVGRFIDTLEAKGTHVDRAVLFGSCARGKCHPHSDIDLVVISEDFIGKNHIERVDAMIDALYEVWEPIEAIPVTPEEWDSDETLIIQYAKEGELVYAATSGR